MDSYRRILPHSSIEPPMAELVPVPPEPREPFIFWIVCIFLGIPLWFVSEQFFFFHHYAQLMLATAWMALAAGLNKRSFIPAALCYVPLLILGGILGFFFASILLVSLGLPWLVLRACRLLALDWQRRGPGGTLLTPRLAERAQFSLQTLIIIFVVAALGSVCYVSFKEYREFEFLWLTLGLYMPLELLMLLGMLSRLAWYWRGLLLALVPAGLMGFLFATTNSRHAQDLWYLLIIPGSQLLVLAVLRGAGYRLGMPRLKNESTNTIAPAVTSSSWDEIE
jgi:hypothetical protein